MVTIVTTPLDYPSVKGMDQATAVATLAALFITPTFAEPEFDPLVLEDLVKSQIPDPAVTSTVDPETVEVILTLSLGPAPPPDVLPVPPGFRVVFPIKHQAAVLLTTAFNFISKLALGETIISEAVIAQVYTGTDPSPQAMVSGAAVIEGAIVKQSIIGGISGVIYQLFCIVTTSLGNTIQLAGFLAVVP